ncbi:hypothetical protein V1512DRAFT_232109 [Lipomyces arxii]|uniref:uncharacterized protein n=1 Tax=Lipomyces arxii TaxID=56418 RepID=UPI0034CF2AE9
MVANIDGLALLREAVLSYAEAASESPEDSSKPEFELSTVKVLQSSIASLTADLEALNRQQSFKSAAENTKNLVSRLDKFLPQPVTIEEDVTGDLNASEILPKQRQLLAEQRSLIKLYTYLLDFTVESYVFPLSAGIHTAEELDSIELLPELHFDIDSLVATDEDESRSVEFPQYDIAKYYNTVPKSADSAREVKGYSETIKSLEAQLDISAQQRRELEQNVAELEAAMLEISNEQSSQLNTLRREHELSARELHQTRTQLEQQIALQTAENDKQNREMQNSASVAPVALPVDSEADYLKTVISDLRSQIVQLEYEKASIGDAHAAEFETVLTQNAKLNERLAEMEGKRGSGSVPATPASANMPPLTPVSMVNRGSEEMYDNLVQLQTELNLMRINHDSLMNQSLEYENERASLERKISALQEKNQRLEARILDSRVKVLASHTNGNNMSDSNESSSIGILRREFRKMVAEIKSEHAATLNAEYEERRRLEKVIRDMKRAAA